MSGSNKRVIMVMGKPSSGKTTSLLKLAKDPTVAYLNTDLKDLPFQTPKDGLKVLQITDPMDMYQAIDELENDLPEVETVVLDTVTFMMDQFEVQYVTNAADTRAAWGQYATFYKEILHKIKASNKNWIVLAHAFDVYNEKELALETKVPVKGSIGKIGIEADFTIIVTSRKMAVDDLQDFDNEYLRITPKEEAMGIKYVFQTELTRDTMHEKIRSPLGLWEDSELYIDNDIHHLVDKLKQYYSQE